MSAGPLVVAGVKVTHPTRVLQPAGITKAELARYFHTVAPSMLPHLAGRALTIVRCPQGPEQGPACFYQRHPEQRGWPPQLPALTIEEPGGPATYFRVDDVAGLVALAQLGTLEVHTWSSRASDPERPDRVIFDLDPGPGVTFDEVVAGARLVRDALDALGFAAFVKTTGGHGLHVVAPIAPAATFEEARAFARSVVDALVLEHPDRFVGRMAKVERPGRVFIDYLRNAHGATAVAAYSTRSRPGGTVSVPVSWEELGGIDPAAFDIRSVPARLAALEHDPWEGYEAAATHLPTDS